MSRPRESADPRYEVELVVTDGGGKSTTAKLVVNFDNEFSVGPKFDSHIYNATVYDNRSTFNNAPIRVRVSYPPGSPLMSQKGQRQVCKMLFLPFAENLAGCKI